MGKGGDAVDMDFVYSTSRGKLVPVVHDSPGRRSSTVHQVSGRPPLVKNPIGECSDDEDVEASEDEDCPV